MQIIEIGSQNELPFLRVDGMLIILMIGGFQGGWDFGF